MNKRTHRPFGRLTSHPSGMLHEQSGAVAIITGIVTMLLLMGAGVAIDTARLHAVHGKAQASLDAGVLTAASHGLTSSDFEGDAKKVFYTNFPPDYLGSTVTGFSVTESAGTGGSKVYDGTATIDIPVTLMSLFGHTKSTITVQAQSTRGYTTSNTSKLELALVLDSTLSMEKSINGVKKIDGLKEAVVGLLDTIYGQETTLSNAYISVVPYTTAVNLGVSLYKESWIKNPTIFSSQSRFSSWNASLYQQYPFPSNTPWISTISGLRRADGSTVQTDAYVFATTVIDARYLANRSMDILPPANAYELSDEPPNDDLDSKFRTNRGFIVNYDPDNLPAAGPNDFFLQKGAFSHFAVTLGSPPPLYTPYNPSFPQGEWYDLAADKNPLAPMLFAANTKQYVLNTVNAMQPTSQTRINVGLMWGWYTLSPKWQGKFDGRTTIPQSPPVNSKLQKAIVLMTDGRNTVYTGDGVSVANDDETTRALCEKIKATPPNPGNPANTIRLFVIGFGDAGDINLPLLQDCASPNSFFHASDSAALKSIFQTVGQSLSQLTVRLTK